jgi:FkbM family methyltransferase
MDQLKIMNYFQQKLPYLLSQPAFRKHPARLLIRSVIWLFYCAIGHSPRFKLREGVWFKVDPILRLSGSTSAFVLREWAEPELKYLDELLTTGANFIDCGANIGIYTALGAGIVGPQGRVFAVEPSAASFRRLQRNVELNRFTQVSLVNKAISDKETLARLYHADGGPVSFSLVPKAETDFEEVITTTIDRLVEGHKLDHVECIKLDVEGVEIPALRGAQEVLLRFKPAIIFEATSPGQKRQAVTEDIPSLILSLGYNIYHFVGTSPSEIHYKSPNLVGLHPEANKPVPAFLKPWTPTHP